jgi:hypothetical protein
MARSPKLLRPPSFHLPNLKGSRRHDDRAAGGELRAIKEVLDRIAGNTATAVERDDSTSYVSVRSQSHHPKLTPFPLISSHTLGVIAGLVPAIPIVFAAIGTRGTSPRVTAARVASVVDQFHREQY